MGSRFEGSLPARCAGVGGECRGSEFEHIHSEGNLQNSGSVCTFASSNVFCRLLPTSFPASHPSSPPPPYCRHQNSAVRTSAAHCLAALASAWMDALMPPLLRLLLPRLGSPDDATRLGAVEAVVQV